MMWQRARIKVADTVGMIGRRVWVEMKAPEVTRGVGMDGEVRVKKAYVTNMLAPPHRNVMLSAEKVELLGEFADEVPMIDFVEFLSGSLREEA